MHWLDGQRGRGWLWALLLTCAPACGGGDDGAGDDAAATDGTAGDDTGTSSPGDDAPSSADASATGAPGTDGGSTGEDATSAPTTLDDGTTGNPIELCNGWRDVGPDEPWLELYGRGNQLLASGGLFELDCGGQGSWMLPIYPQMGGWDLTDPMVTFDIVIDVEGFAGPSGHFYEATGLYYGLECFDGGDLDGGFGGHACIAVFPPDDTLGDLSVLDGAPTTIHVELHTPEGPVVLDFTDMTLSAPAETIENGCGFG